MITPDYVRLMTAYNVEMNRRLYEAAGRLSDDERRRDRGAFWRSIHGTLSHLLWADRMWMSRFAKWEPPSQALAQSGEGYATFDEMARDREAVDGRLTQWAGALEPDAITGDVTWFSGAMGKTAVAPRALLLTHLFNHQTHHRGQVHAMLTAAGTQTGATDLPFVVPNSGLRFAE